MPPREALELIEVEYEELPAVFTLDDALSAEAPLLHEEPPRSADLRRHHHHPRRAPNICNQFKLRKGDIDAGLRGGRRLFEDTFTSPPRAARRRSRRTACVAQVANGKRHDLGATQMPFIVRAQLAEIFGPRVASA